MNPFGNFKLFNNLSSISQTDRSKLNSNILTSDNEKCDRNIEAFEEKYKTTYSELNCGMNFINIAYDNCSVSELVKISNGKRCNYPRGCVNTRCYKTVTIFTAWNKRPCLPKDTVAQAFENSKFASKAAFHEGNFSSQVDICPDQCIKTDIIAKKDSSRGNFAILTDYLKTVNVTLGG